MLIIPLATFFVLLVVGLVLQELTFKGVLAFLTVWVVCLIGFAALDISGYLFVGVQALLDIALILRIFHGNIVLR
jgi:hypothetical protein